MHQRWKRNVQYGRGDWISNRRNGIRRGTGYGNRGKLFYLQYIWTESRQREGRELFRYCYFHFIVMNHSRRCFGPNHASLMQIERNSVTALRLEYRSNLFSVNLWTQDVFTVSVSFIFYTDCWTASFTNYQENEDWVKIEAIILVSINNAFVIIYSTFRSQAWDFYRLIVDEDAVRFNYHV